ncbi:hypothetical protein GD416_31960 [Burkholderia sp. BE24]|uniref:hypothetical protein n=1 Tax=unclassified Burkholderia TaxID=2613784 RepID=UPI00117DE3D6|nr:MULTISPECIES: hypothetical protein [unclassified Burkholderia]MPV60918.1 hypothetical protein [Burkholderia sp. BE24]
MRNVVDESRIDLVFVEFGTPHPHFTAVFRPVERNLHEFAGQELPALPDARGNARRRRDPVIESVPMTDNRPH